MKKINVFRLENKNGLGPFRGGHRDAAEILKGHFGVKMCLVDNEILNERIFKKFAKQGWLCAWSSENTFEKWMNGQEDFFENLGYFKVQYEVSVYKLCGEQKLFHIDPVTDNYVYEDAEGFQVFFNPNTAIKKIFFK